MRRIEVAVGVIRKADKVLVGQRLVKDKYFEKWEFPGGKLEPGELPEEALARELDEELAITIKQCEPLICLDHNYSDRHVRLHVFEISQYQGEPHGREGQAIQWLEPMECLKLDFLEANQPIVNAVCLPKLVVITDINKYGLHDTLAKIRLIQSRYGAVQVQLREGDVCINTLEKYSDAIKPLLEQGSLLILNGELETAKALMFDGVQLNRHRLLNYVNRTQIDMPWVGASCHNVDELKLAEKIADYALLSPVMQTTSHPDKNGIGWKQYADLVKPVKLPVFALGGMTFNDISTARLQGGQGVALLNGAWQATI